jgi:hypothetical protein
MRITGSVDDVDVDDFSPAVLTTELLSTCHRLGRSSDGRLVGFCAKTSPPGDETNGVSSKTTQIFGEGYFILSI